MTFQKNPVSVRLFAKLMQGVIWLQRLVGRSMPPPFRLMQIGSAFWQSRALYVAACLDIATILGDKPLSIEVIATQANAQSDGVYRLLRMLAAMDVFEEISPKMFKNSALSNYLRTDCPKNVRAMILMHNSSAMSRPWFEQLEAGIRIGEAPFKIVHNQDFYAYLDADAEFDALFAQAMDSVEILAGDRYVNDFDWGRFDRIIDIGGSKGSKTLAILQRYPRLTAVVIDRKQVIQLAVDYWKDNADADLLSRVRFCSGDFLESIPAARNNKDIYLLSTVLHGLDDAQCTQVLRHMLTAIAETGARIAVMELVIPEIHADLASAAFDMQMFMATRGKERTLSEWKTLFAKSGLMLEELVHLKSIGKIMILDGYN